MTTRTKADDTKAKVPTTSAEARKLADQLAAEEEAARKAQEATRRAARHAAALDLLDGYVDGDLKAAITAARDAHTTASAAVPFNLAAWMETRAALRIAQRVHDTVEQFLVTQPIWEGMGRPHDNNGNSMPAPRYVRPHVASRAFSRADDALRIFDATTPNGIDNAVDGAANAAASTALAHVHDLLRKAEDAAITQANA